MGGVRNATLGNRSGRKNEKCGARSKTRSKLFRRIVGGPSSSVGRGPLRWRTLTKVVWPASPSIA